MIGSIFSTLWRARSGQNGDASSDMGQQTGMMTRSNFLRVLSAGVVVSGVGMMAGKAMAGGNGSKIAPVTDLDALYDVWQERFNAADLEGMVDLYVDDVTYINPEGKPLNGKAGIRTDFAAVFPLKPQIVLGDRKHLIYHDVALTTNHWNLVLTMPDGSRQESTGGGIEVLRKQADGGWRFIIDDASRSAS